MGKIGNRLNRIKMGTKKAVTTASFLCAAKCSQALSRGANNELPSRGQHEARIKAAAKITQSEFNDQISCKEENIFQERTLALPVRLRARSISRAGRIYVHRKV